MVIKFNIQPYWLYYLALDNVFTLMTLLLHRVFKIFSTSGTFVWLVASMLSHVLSDIANVSIGVVAVFAFNGV